MLELGGEFDFALEPLRTNGRRQFRMQDLDRYLAIVPQVLGEEDRGHATATKLAFDAVLVRDARLELFEGVRQSSSSRQRRGQPNLEDSIGKPATTDRAGFEPASELPHHTLPTKSGNRVLPRNTPYKLGDFRARTRMESLESRLIRQRARLSTTSSRGPLGITD